MAALRSLTDLDTKQRPRGDGIVPSRLESTDVKEDVSGSVGKLGEAETLLWVEPLDDRVVSLGRQCLGSLAAANGIGSSAAGYNHRRQNRAYGAPGLVPYP